MTELYLDGMQQLAGTWGRIGNGSVDYPSARFLGDGILTVIVGPTATLFKFW